MSLFDEVNALAERWSSYVREKPDQGADYTGYYAGHDACAFQLRGVLNEYAASPQPAETSGDRVDAILRAVLAPRGDEEDGTHDHLPRVLRDFLSEATGRAGATGFDDGWTEGHSVGLDKGYRRAKRDAASLTEPLDKLLGVANDALDAGYTEVAESIMAAVRTIQLAQAPSPQLDASSTVNIDEIDVAGWGVFKCHAIPLHVARYIALKVNERFNIEPQPADAVRDCLPRGHRVLEQADMIDGTGRVAQTVGVGVENTPGYEEYQRIVHADEAYVEGAALTDPAPAGEEERDCPTCAGNGEVVKDWGKYLHGEGGPEQEDHGVADCATCGGSGRISSEPAPAEEAVEPDEDDENEDTTRLWWFLRVLDACGARGADASDEPGEWVAAFCGDADPTDTFNLACNLKLAICTHNGMDETSRIWINDAGKAWLAAHPAPEDTARLREDLERVTRERDAPRISHEAVAQDANEMDAAMSMAWAVLGGCHDLSLAEEIMALMRRNSDKATKLAAAERERDDARKALEPFASVVSGGWGSALAPSTQMKPSRADGLGSYALLTIGDFFSALAARSASREATR